MRTFLVTGALLLVCARLAAADQAAEQLALYLKAECGGVVDGSTPMCFMPVAVDVATGASPIPLPASPAAWSPDGRKLLFERDGEVYLAAATGAPLVNLTNHGAFDGTPAWSPDGSKIAFASDRDGPLDLYLMNPDGSGVVRLPTSMGMAWQPTWSPDGTRLAFTCVDEPVGLQWWYTPADVMDICTIALAGSGLTKLTSEYGPDMDPAWSPQGTRIAFSTGRNDGLSVAVMNTDGSGMARLTSGSYSYAPSWSSDGTRIAFAVNDEGAPPSVVLMNADGTNQTFFAFGYGPRWRPWAGGLNTKPIAAFAVNCVDAKCAFDASASWDPDGTVTNYGWYFSDGGTAAGSAVSHQSAAGYSYFVQLVVMDDKGALSIRARRQSQSPTGCIVHRGVHRAGVHV